MTQIMKSICPVIGCGVEKRADRLMCPRHWVMVPVHLQRAVWSSWQNRNWPEWRRAKDEAIKVVDSDVKAQGLLEDSNSGGVQLDLL